MLGSTKLIHTMTNTLTLQSRLQAALWGFFSGDALSAPTHWYYGGARQVRSDYGQITDYVKPKETLFGSILNKSNTNGGGRGRFSKGPGGISIIGDVINHGKWEYWDPKLSVHYHATLQAGENTLEASLARVLMKSIVANKGKFNQEHFRKAYVDFMTTPGSHNDTYASTCHRMFFANLIFHKRDPKDCPDNDGHNVDTIDGLILPTITALAYSVQSKSNPEEAYQAIAETIAVTRNSSTLVQMSKPLARIIWNALSDDDSLEHSLKEAAKSLGFHTPQIRSQDGISACYLRDSLPPLLDMMMKYSSPQFKPNDVWTGLLANANAGGENVHRGSILGAVLGAAASTTDAMPNTLINGLYHKQELEQEINDFVDCILRENSNNEL